jgi:hypothetical protein
VLLPEYPLSQLDILFLFHSIATSIERSVVIQINMLSAPRRNLTQLIATSAIAGLSFLAIAALQIPQLSELQKRAQAPSIEQARQAIEVEKLRLNLLKNSPSFGYDNVIADWAYLNFLQYFGDEAARQLTDYRLSPDFFDVVIGRDPRFLQAYVFLSTSTAIYAGQPERSVALMNKGVEALTPTAPPGSHYVWRAKAIDELLFIGDAQAARRSFETAADWATASGLPGSENVVTVSRQTAKFLSTNPDSRMAQGAAWAMVLTSAVDDRTHQTAVQRIQALGGTVTQAPDGTFRVQLPTKD